MMSKKPMQATSKKNLPKPVGMKQLHLPAAQDTQIPNPTSHPGSVSILSPADTLDTLRAQTGHFTVTMLDPWYNRGVGGVVEGYEEWIGVLLGEAARISDHIFLWGFPEIICCALRRIPSSMKLTAWLTWYFKNCPSVIRGWRSAQMACLHFSSPGAKIYPEHFLNEAQLEKQAQGKLRYMPGPATVIETSLIIGFVGRKEQVGHPAQKPEAVYEPLFRMTTKPGDTVLDPMCGSGTTGAIALSRGLHAVLCDSSEDYVKMSEKRLGIKRHRQNSVSERRKPAASLSSEQLG